MIFFHKLYWDGLVAPQEFFLSHLPSIDFMNMHWTALDGQLKSDRQSHGSS